MPVSRYPVRTVNLKRFALLVLLFVAFGGVAFAVHRLQVRKNAELMLNQARNMERSDRTEDLNEAQMLYERYLNFRPRDPGATDSYLEVLAKLVEREPKRILELVKAYERVLIVDAKRNDVRRKTVELYLRIRNYNQASRHLEELVGYDEASRDDPTVLEQRGLCAEKLGKKELAIERYTTAIEKGQGKASTEAYIRLANIYSKEEGKEAQDKARKLLDRMLAEKPRDPQARLARAKFFLEARQKPQAVAELQAAIDESPQGAKSPEIVTILADLYRQANNLPAAKELLARAVAAVPEEYKYRLIYADLLVMAGDSAGSRRELRQALELVPITDVRALDALDRMIVRHPEERPIVLEEIRKRFDGKPGGYAEYLNGKFKLAGGKWNEAQEFLKRAIPPFQTNKKLLAKAYEALGECARAANNPEKMAEYYDQARTADPSLDSARLGYAEAQLRLGNVDDAAKTFNSYAAASPEARYQLARLAFEEQLLAEKPDWAKFEEAIGPAPRSANLELLRIASLRAKKQPAEAFAAAKALIDAQPKQPFGYFVFATLKAEQDPKAALAFLDANAEVLGDTSEARLAKAGILASDAGTPTGRLLALADDTANFPNDDLFRLYYGLAELLVRPLNKLAEAAAMYSRAAEVKPNDLASRVRLFEMLLALKRFGEADAVVDQMRALEGEDGPAAQFALASRRALTLQPGDRTTLEDLRKRMAGVVKARPKWGRAMLLAAELDDAAGDGDAALEKFRKALLLGERRPGSVRRHVALLIERRRYGEARQVLELAEKTIALGDDQLRQMSLIEAVTNAKTNRSNELVKATLESPNAADHAFRGHWHLLAQQPAEAMAAFEKAIAIDGTLPESWMGLILAAVMTAEPESVKAVWTKALAALPEMKFKEPVEKPLWLGLANEAMGRIAEAKQAYDDGLKQSPNHPMLLAQLASLATRLGDANATRMLYQNLLAAKATPELQRQARRELAWLEVAQAGWQGVPAAMKLLEANAPPRGEDLRMAGLVLSFDPFRRESARELIAKAARSSSPGSLDAQRLVEFYVRDSRLGDAEELLASATAAGATVPQLMLLHALQIKTDRKDKAKDTLVRLKKLAAGSWEAAVEETRAMASDGRQAEAASRLLAHPYAAEPARKLSAAAPALAEIGCPQDAEMLYRKLVETTQLPRRHMALLLFLAGQNRGLEALQIAAALPDGETEPAAKANLLIATLLPLPRAAVRAGDRAAWDAAYEAAAKWLAIQQAKTPNDKTLKTLQGALADVQGRYAEAARHFEDTLKLDSTSETAANSLAWLLAFQEKPQWQEALAMIDGLIGRVGPKPALLDTRSLIRLKLGDIPGAQADNQAARAQLPDKAAYYFRLAQIKDRTGETDASKKALIAARAKGLRRESLHPLEWPAYDALTSSVLGRSE